MNTSFHTPSLGDEVFDFDDASTSTPTPISIAGKTKSSLLYQQQTPPSAKHLISLQNTSDEYHTANEETFDATQSTSMNNSITQQSNSTNNALQGRQTGMAAITTTGPTTMAARKQMLPVDPSEPAKPLSAYALFFRDTVSAIKQQNPTCSFQELSKIVASMWDALDPADKGVYNKRNELARVEYLKQMKIYQQQQQQKQEQLTANEALQTDTSNQQQTTTQKVAQPVAANVSVQQNTPQVNSTPATSNSVPTTAAGDNSNGASDDQTRLSNEAGGAVQICLRENCNKRAVISPDWEDEYCSNECVVIHCRNVFNDWVQSNLEAKQQEQPDANTT